MAALGIFGSTSSAVLIGALTIQGIQPGPLLFSKNPEIPYSIFASLLFGVPIMVAIGLLGARVWMKATSIQKSMLAAAVTGICVLGAFFHSNSMYLVWVMMACGIVGYFLWIGGEIFPGCCPNNAC